ncbi:hypothetical protein V2J09_016359 [Rumex salicifolius]
MHKASLVVFGYFGAPKKSTHNSSLAFSEFVDEYHLIDLGYSGSQFTWKGERSYKHIKLAAWTVDSALTSGEPYSRKP